MRITFCVAGYVLAGGLAIGAGRTLETITVTVLVALLPAASRATAYMVRGPLGRDVVLRVVVYGNVVSSKMTVLIELLNCTPSIPDVACPEGLEGSEAVAEMVIVPDTVASATGSVIATVGAVVSSLPITTQDALLYVLDSEKVPLLQVRFCEYDAQIAGNATVDAE